MNPSSNPLPRPSRTRRPGRALGLSLLLLLGAATAPATERRFTYTYEPETLPQGAWEIEHWTTWRAGRGAAAGKEDYQRFDFREELEYGVTDRYTVALYLNSRHQSYFNPRKGQDYSRFESKGVSLENIYQVWNPAEHAVGLSLYAEPTLNDDEAKFEQKLILGFGF